MLNQGKIIELIQILIKTNSWKKHKRLVLAKRQLLLSDGLDQVFDQLLGQYADDAQTTSLLSKRRALLARCRSEGIDAAFAPFNKEHHKQVKYTKYGVKVLLKYKMIEKNEVLTWPLKRETESLSKNGEKRYNKRLIQLNLN